MKHHKFTLALLAVGVLLAATSSYAGTSYKFTVSCQYRQLAVQWNTGDIDPGKEFLRVSTGTKHPGCGVTDFNPARDAHLPVETYSGPAGVVLGIPLLGTLLGKVFGI